MKLTVTARQIVVTPPQRAAIRRQAERAARPLGDAAISAQVIVYRERTLLVCELTVHARGEKVLHGKGRGRAFTAALATATQRVGRQAKTLADRWKSRRKGYEA